MYLGRWAHMGHLPRAGGIMDQDPEELMLIDMALEAFQERREIEERQAANRKG